MTSTFVCGGCGSLIETAEEFDKKAIEEAERLWGVPDAHKNPDMVRICDDCFKELIETGLKETKNMRSHE